MTRAPFKWVHRGARSQHHRHLTYLASHYARLRGRHGSKKAAVAVGHSILVIAYHVLEREVPHEELSEDYFHRQRSRRTPRSRLVRKLEGLGHKVALEPLPQSG